MTVESRFRSSSKRLINRFGRTRIYIQKVDPVYDFETQEMTLREVLHAVKMFKTDPKEMEIKSPNLVGKTVDVMMISAVDLPIKPKVGDYIRDQYLGVDEVLEVVQVKANEAGESVATWRLICTKS